MKEESKRDYRMANNLWCTGATSYVCKIGSRWRRANCFGNFPLYKTKKEAIEVANRFILNNH